MYEHYYIKSNDTWYWILEMNFVIYFLYESIFQEDKSWCMFNVYLSWLENEILLKIILGNDLVYLLFSKFVFRSIWIYMLLYMLSRPDMEPRFPGQRRCKIAIIKQIKKSKLVKGSAESCVSPTTTAVRLKILCWL